MHLTVLGCSGSVNGPGAACSGYLVSVPGELPVLIDCGPGVFGELQAVADPNDVAVVLSHLHADHCMDLPAMLVWRRWAPVPAIGRVPLWGPRAPLGASAPDRRSSPAKSTTSATRSRSPSGSKVRPLNCADCPLPLPDGPPAGDLRPACVTGPNGEVLAYSGDTARATSSSSWRAARMCFLRGVVDPRSREPSAAPAHVRRRGRRGRHRSRCRRPRGHAHPAVDVDRRYPRRGPLQLLRPHRAGPTGPGVGRLRGVVTRVRPRALE